MSLFYSLYHLFSILIYSVSLGICFLTYGRTEKKDLQYGGLMMLAYIFESVYALTQYFLDFRYSTHSLALTAMLALTVVKVYLLGRIVYAIFEKAVSTTLYMALCAIIIVYGLVSTSPGNLYWYLDSITFNISVLTICGFFWSSLVQEADTTRHQNASKYAPVITIMLIFSTLALLYIFTSLSLYQTVLSQTFIDLSTNFYCLILAIWFIIFCQKEYEVYTTQKAEKIEDVFQECFHEFQVHDQENLSTTPVEQMSDFCSQYELTERETEILHLILAGKTNQEISEILYITVGTVKAHVHSIFGKLDVSRRSQLMTMFLDYGTK